MAKFLTTRSTTSEIEKIINNANKSVVLITPFVRIPDSLFQNIITADKRDVRITLIYGKKRLKRDVYEQLEQLKNLKLYYLENLHAKCYFNEQCMVITSLNLYDFSEQANREMGVLVTRQDDKDVFTEAVREAQMIMSLASSQDLRHRIDEQSLTQTTDKVKTTPKEAKGELGSAFLRGFSDILLDAVGLGKGHCIGCKTRIKYDEYRPYCPDCFKQWSKNKRQRASYCHSCGRVATTSINKPVCHFCWEKTIEYR